MHVFTKVLLTKLILHMLLTVWTQILNIPHLLIFFYFGIFLQLHLIPFNFQTKFKDGVLINLSKHIVCILSSHFPLTSIVFQRFIPTSAQHCLILTIQISKEYNYPMIFNYGKGPSPLYMNFLIVKEKVR